jgi:hypothetical protein
MSAIAAGAGTNQVQSRNDWTPNTTGTSRIVTRAMRLASQSRRIGASSAVAARTMRRGSSPVALSAAIVQVMNSSVVRASPIRPRSAMICGIQPWACRVTEVSLRKRSRPTANAPAPAP